MSNIRPFTQDDIPEIADLWRAVFLHAARPSPASLTAYFTEMFFENPWVNPSYPSLVYQTRNGIAGFLGVWPRPMIFQGKRIQAAVVTQFMAATGWRQGFPGIELLKHFLAGPQDLSFTDGATDAGSRAFELLGAQIARLYCFDWTRILRPAQYNLHLLEARKPLALIARTLRPFSWTLDKFASTLPIGRYYFHPPAEQIQAASDRELLDCLAEFTKNRSLTPEYDAGTLGWLLDRAAQARGRGPLQKAIVRDENGELLGWYICHIKPGGVSEVLQLSGKANSTGRIARALAHHARESGSLALSGQLDPLMARELTDSHCQFRCLSLGVPFHSRHPEILNAIHCGDAFLTRLEGEWWNHFREAAGS